MASNFTFRGFRMCLWVATGTLFLLAAFPVPARAQSIQWIRQFGTANDDFVYGVAVDASGVYVVGSTPGRLPGQTSFGAGDAFVRKYDANGNELWTRQFGSTAAGSDDRAYGVSADATGIYLVGYTMGPLPGQTNGGGFLRKYDHGGNELWTRQFFSVFPALATDSTGVFVVGTSRGSFITRYDLSGNASWSSQLPVGSPGDVEAVGVAVYGTSIYVAGHTYGTLPGQIKIGGRGNVDAFVVKLAASSALPPAVSDGGVVNSASYAPSPVPVAPGSIAAIFGSNLNNGSAVLFSCFGPDGKLATSLGGASVRINDIPAPMFYSTPGQLGIQIPFELAGQTSATIQATVGGQTSLSRTIFLDALAPGIFTANNQGTGAAAALHEDGVTPVTEQRPARPGEVVVLYATGLGAVTPALATGAPSTGNRTSATATVNIDGIPGEVQFSGTAPGFVGLNQINIQIPPNTRPAPNIPVVLSIGGKQSNSVTIAVSP